MYPFDPLTPEQHADLYARARRQARLLRQDARDAFWHGVYRLGARALRGAQRARRRTSAFAASRSPLSRNPSGA